MGLYASRLPKWLYIQNDEARTTSCQSTTTGAFSLGAALAEKLNAFEAAIPSTLPPEYEKKRLFICDFSLNYEFGDIFLTLVQTFKILVEEGFEISLFDTKQQNLVKISEDPENPELLRLFCDSLDLLPEEIKKYDPSFSLDTCAILSYNTFREVASSLFILDYRNTIRDRLGGNKVADLLNMQVVPYCLRYNTSLAGHDLPEIPLDQYVLDLIEVQIKYDKCIHSRSLFEDFINWGFKFILVDDAAYWLALNDTIRFPVDKISGVVFESRGRNSGPFYQKYSEMTFDKVWIYYLEQHDEGLTKRLCSKAESLYIAPPILPTTKTPLNVNALLGDNTRLKTLTLCTFKLSDINLETEKLEYLCLKNSEISEEEIINMMNQHPKLERILLQEKELRRKEYLTLPSYSDEDSVYIRVNGEMYEARLRPDNIQICEQIQNLRSIQLYDTNNFKKFRRETYLGNTEFKKYGELKNLCIKIELSNFELREYLQCDLLQYIYELPALTALWFIVPHDGHLDNMTNFKHYIVIMLATAGILQEKMETEIELELRRPHSINPQNCIRKSIMVSQLFRLVNDLLLGTDLEFQIQENSKISFSWHQQIRSFNTLFRAAYTFSRIRGEYPEAGYIYDGKMTGSSETISIGKQPHKNYQLYPVCKILPGGQPFAEVRRISYTLDFQGGVHQDPKTIYIKPHFVEPKLSHEPPTHEFNYEPDFELEPESGKYIHRLQSLSLDESICTWRISDNTQNYILKYSDSDDYHYLITDRAPQGTPTIHYTTRSFPKLAPNEIQALGQPFRQTYTEDKRTHHNRTLDDLITNPQYYECAQRTVGFMYKYADHPANFRVTNSSSHSWIECSQGSMDLGGGGSYSLIYNQPKDSLIYNQPKDSTPKQAPSPPPQIYEYINNQPALIDELEVEGKNTLLVFKSQEKLEEARIALMKHFGASIIVIDHPSQLQLQKDFITLGENTAYIHKAPGGWLSNQLDKNESKLLMINWSEFSPKKAAQSNGCIGVIEQRSIQGRKLDPKFHVFGCLLIGDPLLEEPSFISRHQGRVFFCEKIDFSEPAPQLTDEAEVRAEIQLYGSPHWFDLLMGKITLNEDRAEYKPSDIHKQGVNTLIIHNPPFEDKDFNRLIEQLKSGLALRYYDQNIQFKPMKVILMRGYDFEKYFDNVASVTSNIIDTDLVEIQIDQTLTPATFERALQDTYIEGTLLKSTLGWIQASPKNELHLFITRTLSPQQYCALFEAAEGKKLHFYLAPQAELPPHFNGVIKAKRNEEEIPQRPSRIITEKELTSKDKIIDVTGRSPDEILYGYHYSYADQRFIFSESVSEVWTALQSGHTVYLTGIFSDEMVDHLSSLLLPQGSLWHHHKNDSFKGQLTLCPEKPIPSLNWVTQNKFIADLKLPAIKVEVLSAHEPAKGSKDFHEARLNSLKTAIEHRPAIFIHGEPGSGKSSFIRMLMLDPQFKVYTENQIMEWANAPEDNPLSLLIIDEATIRGSDWRIFEGLFTPHPHLLIQGHIYWIKPHQKIVFLGNIVNKMPSLFSKVSTLNFKALSQDYIIDYILEPIFEDRNLAMSFYKANSKLPIRELQAAAISTRASRFPAHFPSNTLKTFMMTESRQGLLKSLLDSLNVREFMLNAKNEPGQFGGQTGVWIEGPAGVGKTQIIQSVLNDFGYEENIDYYNLPADMDPETMIKLIRRAFQEGKLIVAHEMDTWLTPEYTAEINAYLMGEDLNMNRPPRPGFALWATGNGGLLPGRVVLPDSLRTRLSCHTVENFSLEEARLVCHSLFSNKLQPDVIEGHIQYHLAYPKLFTFRQLLDTLRAGGDTNIPSRPSPQVIIPNPPTENTLQFTRFIPEYTKERRKPEPPKV